VNSCLTDGSLTLEPSSETEYTYTMELTDKNYESIIKNSETPVFIDFYSPTCGPCQMLTKLIDERLEKYGEENGVKVVKCNVAKNPKLAEAFKIESVPFTIAVLPNEKLKYAETGLKHEAYYFELIDKLAGKGSFFSRLFT
jgi:thioredoxin 1